MRARHSLKRIHLIVESETVVTAFVGVFGAADDETALAPLWPESSMLR